ncbi:PREDICTED: E3 ubiquitin-protein ligase Topors-like [Nipponia nippon]|uniref:E3 ubiquitin-protein ligase Topors-like n=1 Tax=Nipponia nippon TaxID=128390 RepID=UPI0005115FC1|nr:PREDICTED: E3 ubiquitin-protein ligase Topors-like [Nipponia nippon]
MASGAKEALQDSGSATTAGTRQLQRAGRREAAADGPCPICLDDVDDAAYIDICFHAFCFDCIQRWVASRAVCPLCRRPFNHILHMVRAGNGLSPRRQRTAARQRVRSRSPQRRYHLRPRPNNNERAAGRRGPVGSDQAAWRDAAPGTSNASNASAQQAAGERPASPAHTPVLHLDTLALQAQIIGFVDIE